MHLYLIIRIDKSGYDSFKSVVVAAESEEDAKKIHPDMQYHWLDDAWRHKKNYGQTMGTYGWADPKYLSASLIGDAHINVLPGTVLCSSYSAG